MQLQYGLKELGKRQISIYFLKLSRNKLLVSRYSNSINDVLTQKQLRKETLIIPILTWPTLMLTVIFAYYSIRFIYCFTFLQLIAMVISDSLKYF